jgi:hypothetical protein
VREKGADRAQSLPTATNHPTLAAKHASSLVLQLFRLGYFRHVETASADGDDPKLTENLSGVLDDIRQINEGPSTRANADIEAQDARHAPLLNFPLS